MRLVVLALLTLSLAACSSGTPTGLPAGLTARMDVAGAQLDRNEALNIVNQFRASRGVAPVALDADLNARAQTLASQYAASNTPPSQSGAAAMRVSAGYTTFAETFSGWRGRESEASALAAPDHSRMGIAVAHSDNSTYGTHWVVLFESQTLAAN